MSILSGAFCQTLEGAAVGYLLNELSVIPLVGKVNKWGWKVYTTRRAHIVDIHWWKNDNKLKNIGIVCGAVSGNLVVIDLDGQEAIDLFKPAFGDLMARTFTVRTGSGGLHVYLHCDTMPANRKVKIGSGHSGIEVRGEGQYVVAVPSIHPDTGKPYQIHIRKPVLRMDGLWEVNNWLNTLETPKKAVVAVREVEREPSIGEGSTVVMKDRLGRPVKNPRAYAVASLQSEIDRVGRATKGNQNDSLYAAAQRMGQLITMGLLVQSEVVDALRRGTWRWTDSDQTEQEMLNTIASGLKSKAAEDTR